MKHILSILLILALLVPGIAAAQDDDLTASARSIVELLYQGEYQTVFDQSTAEVQSSLVSAEGLESIWSQLASVYGEYEGITEITASSVSGLITAVVVCSHLYADITYTIAFDADGLMSGLTITDLVSKLSASDDDSDDSGFITETITLREGEEDETQGILTLPVGEGPFPVVIMLHGSGQNDMNETSYGITAFLDLAEGLAAAGIASIRYDKYTYAHADLIAADEELAASFTIQEEYINDAQAALELLQADERIGNIYLLGHSLGGMIIPRVMQTLGGDNFSGGIVLCGTPLQLWEISYHQNLAIIEDMDEESYAAALAVIDAEVARLDELETMTDEELQSTTFFGLSAYYQMDLISVDTAQTAIDLQIPLLIVQGGKDWQITPEDGIEEWQAALGDSLDVTYKLYPDMHHLLRDIEGEAAENTGDYVSGPISQTLIDDVAAWILAEEAD